jgi:glutathione S-transferase
VGYGLQLWQIHRTSLQTIDYVRLCLTAICGLQILGDDIRDRFLGSHEKILTWIHNVKKATNPHFEEVHELLFKVKALMQSKAAAAANQPGTKFKTASKL